jgi:hypothetical protein
MVRSAHSRVARHAGVALLPAVIVLCCAGRAAAECGSYVTIIDEKGQAHPAGERGGPKAPCHGPFCDGGPKAPAPAPPAPVNPIPDVKCLLADAGDDPGPGGARRVCLDPDGSPVHEPRPIFHPPRSV